jgi:hypothetical protein
VTENPSRFEASSTVPLSSRDEKLQEVLIRLNNPRLSGGAYSARCPAHDDHKPSLRVSLGRYGEVFIHCAAGCTREAVLARLGMTVEEAASDRQSRARQPERRHEYHDADGRPVAVKVKWGGRGKRFALERPDGRKGLDGLDPGLYRRPQVDAAVQARDVVWLVEGERDADTLAATGRTATTGPHGASTWRSEWNAPLTGAAVLIVADRDKRGAHHAMRVATELAGAGCTVTTLVPPAATRTSPSCSPRAAGSRISSPEYGHRSRSAEGPPDEGRPSPVRHDPRPADRHTRPVVLRLIAFLDVEQGNGRPLAGRNLLAKSLGWGNAQTSEHLDHLAAAGLIKVEQSGQRRAAYRVLNPSRIRPSKGRDGPPQVPSVDHPVVHPNAICGPRQDPQSRSSGLQKVSADAEADAVAHLQESFEGSTVSS